MGIPLNVVDLPAGSYSVIVNGSRADFKLDTATSTSTLRTVDMPIVKNDIQVDSVNIDFGVGSPIPTHAIVSGNLPNACAQLGEVRAHRDGTTFFVRLVAYIPAQTDCNPDTLPFRGDRSFSVLTNAELAALVIGTTTYRESTASPRSLAFHMGDRLCVGFLHRRSYLHCHRSGCSIVVRSPDRLPRFRHLDLAVCVDRVAHRCDPYEAYRSNAAERLR